MCLQATELSLARKDINLLMGHVDINQDGLVDYTAFVPICFNIMVERFADQVMRNTLLSTDDQMQNYIMHCFRHFDTEGTAPQPALAPPPACGTAKCALGGKPICTFGCPFY
jgi:hypothetical protein